MTFADAFVQGHRLVEVSAAKGALGEEQQAGGFRVELVVGPVVQEGLQRVVSARFVGVESAHRDVCEQVGPCPLTCPCREKVGRSDSVAGCDGHDRRDAAQPYALVAQDTVIALALCGYWLERRNRQAP